MARRTSTIVGVERRNIRRSVLSDLYHWLIAGTAEIDGINTYLHLDDKQRTYSPYFSNETVGKLVRGL